MNTPSVIVNKKRVLVVDDDYGITQMLSMLLEVRGYDVKIASCGKQAIEMAASHSWDIILLDLMLPDVEGFEVCRLLKEEKRTTHIPIIILSSKFLFEDKIEGLYLGADDYLTKPFEHEELFARMEAVMRRGSNFAAESLQASQQSIILELRKILADQLVTPYFQPIFNLSPHKFHGIEVLTRSRTKGSLVNPESLFKAALQFGCYTDLEMLVWKKALEMFRSQKKVSKKIFLNCNPYLIEGSSFDRICSVFKELDISPSDVVLEITERSVIADFKTFYRDLDQFRKYGFQFAVDDVGGGYASLESIVEIRPEVVKIDGHIISNIHNDLFKQSIVKFLVSFCKERGILAIAEGIESQDELDVVIDMGVEAGQGYFLHYPTPDLNLACLSRKR